MSKFKKIIARPKFSKKCKDDDHFFVIKYSDKNNPYYECQNCLVILVK